MIHSPSFIIIPHDLSSLQPPSPPPRDLSRLSAAGGGAQRIITDLPMGADGMQARPLPFVAPYRYVHRICATDEFHIVITAAGGDTRRGHHGLHAPAGAKAIAGCALVAPCRGPDGRRGRRDVAVWLRAPRACVNIFTCTNCAQCAAHVYSRATQGTTRGD